MKLNTVGWKCLSHRDGPALKSTCARGLWQERCSLPQRWVLSLAIGSMGQAGLPYSYSMIFLTERKEIGQSGPYGYKCCPHVVPAVVSNIIYTLLTLGLFAIKIRRDRNSSRTFKDLHNHY